MFTAGGTQLDALRYSRPPLVSLRGRAARPCPSPQSVSWGHAPSPALPPPLRVLLNVKCAEGLPEKDYPDLGLRERSEIPSFSVAKSLDNIR